MTYSPTFAASAKTTAEIYMPLPHTPSALRENNQPDQAWILSIKLFIWIRSEARCSDFWFRSVYHKLAAMMFIWRHCRNNMLGTTHAFLSRV